MPSLVNHLATLRKSYVAFQVSKGLVDLSLCSVRSDFVKERIVLSSRHGFDCQHLCFDVGRVTTEPSQSRISLR
jgi:hypothetical protein